MNKPLSDEELAANLAHVRLQERKFSGGVVIDLHALTTPDGMFDEQGLGDLADELNVAWGLDKDTSLTEGSRPRQ